MVLYHFHVGQIGRSKGHSAIAAAAYRAGQKLYDDYYGETQDYTHKSGVIYEEIMLPPNAHERYADRQTLWNEVERCERHHKTQLAYSFDIALQNELTREENITLARQFIKDNFVAKGMICDWAVHEPDGKGIAGAGRRTPENEVPKKSFQDILESKSAEADLFLLSLTYMLSTL